MSSRHGWRVVCPYEAQFLGCHGMQQQRSAFKLTAFPSSPEQTRALLPILPLELSDTCYHVLLFQPARIVCTSNPRHRPSINVVQGAVPVSIAKEPQQTRDTYRGRSLGVQPLKNQASDG